MTRWRTVHNRRRRPPRQVRPDWATPEDWAAIARVGDRLAMAMYGVPDPYKPMILPEQIPDILAYGKCITRFKGDGTVERIDPNDIYVRGG